MASPKPQSDQKAAAHGAAHRRPWGPPPVLAALTDFSPRAAEAVKLCAALAAQLQTSWHLAHFIPPGPRSSPREAHASVLAQRQRLQQLAAEFAAEGNAPVVHCEPHAIAARLNSWVRENGVSVIVLASSNGSAFEAPVLGRVAEEVLRLAQVPLLLLGPRSQAPRLPFRRVLCAADVRPGAKAAVRAALALMVARDGRVLLIHVAEPRPDDCAACGVGVSDAAARMWETLPPEIRFFHDAEVRVRFGQAADAIVAAAHGDASDLIGVCTEARRTGADAGPMLPAVLRLSTCPVLVAADA